METVTNDIQWEILQGAKFQCKVKIPYRRNFGRIKF